jgi:chromate transporter
MLAQLFLTFAFIGAFSFGGGYGMLPLLQKEIVYTHNWLTSQEFADILAVAEMTPGPVAINAATFVGYKVAGFWGAAFATVGVVTPSLLIILTLAGIVLKNKENPSFKGAFSGLRPVVVALIIGAAYLIAVETLHSAASYVLFGVALLVLKLTRINPILVIMGFGILGILLY